MRVIQAVIPEGTCQSGSFRHRRSRLPEQVPEFWEFRNLWIIESSNMLYVCYMFEQHITYFKGSGYRGLRPIMLEGYMFLRN